jgi:hypothetical protein
VAKIVHYFVSAPLRAWSPREAFGGGNGAATPSLLLAKGSEKAMKTQQFRPSLQTPFQIPMNSL